MIDLNLNNSKSAYEINNSLSSSLRHSKSLTSNPTINFDSKINTNHTTNTLKKIKIKKKKLNKSNNFDSTTVSSLIDQASEIGEKTIEDKNALYDMIEKIQGDRLDNQRCELNQDYSVSALVCLIQL